jgi:hypothetical protein
MNEKEIPRWKKGVNKGFTELAGFTGLGGWIFLIISLYKAIERYFLGIPIEGVRVTIIKIFGRTSKEISVDGIMLVLGFILVFVSIGFDWLAERIIPTPPMEVSTE